MDTLSEKDLKGTRIAVAMSGGVDSSVTAAMLARQGHDVIGVTMKLHAFGNAAEDARNVAEAIGIPHHVFDFEDIFSTCIIGDFADTYLRGETPIPCVKCNQRIKFGALMESARNLGAEALATGHYARIFRGAKGAELRRAADETRDQSYFLFAASQAQLDFLRFPLGDIQSKDETRRLGKEWNLPVAEKPDSQDICFLPDGDYASLVAKLRPEAIVAGDIVDEKGNILGRHEGIIHFTVGQRRGINLSSRVGENNEPLYVLRLDADKRQVVVGLREALARREVHLRDMNWLGDPAPSEGIRIAVKLRSAQKLLPATFYMKEEERGLVVLNEPAFAIAPGQAGVIYDGERVLGGGWIVSQEP